MNKHLLMFRVETKVFLLCKNANHAFISNAMNFILTWKKVSSNNIQTNYLNMTYKLFLICFRLRKAWKLSPAMASASTDLRSLIRARIASTKIRTALPALTKHFFAKKYLKFIVFTLYINKRNWIKNWSVNCTMSNYCFGLGK